MIKLNLLNFIGRFLVKVLITGAEGFIGSHLVDKMINQKIIS